jgi:hypothetical protein
MLAGGRPEFRSLTGIYEPSAVQQLADGRFIVVEDEKEHPFSLVTIATDGAIASAPLEPGLLDFNDAFWKLDDLEGITADRAGWIYAITSHSRNDDGDEKKTREKLVRFRVEGDRMREPSVVKGLKLALAAAHPVLAAAAGLRGVKAEGGLNIEALEITPDQHHLLIGFRSPLLDGRAIIARIDNPAAMFASEASPVIASVLETLDLGGHGIRALAHIPALDGYLVVSGPVAREPTQFQLWFWGGDGAVPRRREIPGLAGFEHAEGVCAAVVAGRQHILVVSDDGSRKEGRCARFLLLDPECLSGVAR